MPQNFYEMLGIDALATMSDVELAYKRKLGRLVRRKREAEKSGAPLGVLEREERDIREAVGVLTDQRRKRRYDAFRQASENGFPARLDGLWRMIQDSAMDPINVEALQLLSSLTKLPLSEITRRKMPAEDKMEQMSIDEEVVKTEPRLRIDLSQDIQVPKEVSKPTLERMPRTRNALKKETVKPQRRKTRYTVEELSGKYGYSGSFLQAVRESKSISIRELSHTTKLKPDIINAIEQEIFSKLQSETYVRGYLKALIRALDLLNYRTIIIDTYIKSINKRRR
jgi:curved DNA-binding protein CbpA